MSRRVQIGILVVLLLVLSGVLYRNFGPDDSADSDLPAAIAVQPLKVPNPALHLDQLARIRQLVYTGSHRNIFSATPPPRVAALPRPTRRAVAPVARVGPPIPRPLQVPLKFYGMAVDPKTNNKVAFFTNGDNVYIAKPGETLLGHFRVLEIGTDTVRIEDTATSQTGLLKMTPLSNP